MTKRRSALERGSFQTTRAATQTEWSVSTFSSHGASSSGQAEVHAQDLLDDEAVVGFHRSSTTPGIDISHLPQTLGNALGQSALPTSRKYFERLIETDWTNLSGSTGSSLQSLTAVKKNGAFYYDFRSVFAKTTPNLYHIIDFLIRTELVNMHLLLLSIFKAQTDSGVPPDIAWSASRSRFFCRNSIAPGIWLTDNPDPADYSVVSDELLRKASRWSSLVDSFEGVEILLISQPNNPDCTFINIFDIIENGTDTEFKQCKKVLLTPHSMMKETICRLSGFGTLSILGARIGELPRYQVGTFGHAVILDAISWQIRQLSIDSRPDSITDSTSSS
ncbi:MAG: hypothetical protein M1812_005308 [Candelaria pacifica]|nr:MAG: hypothetical protein M1812_005308 [Candelaria pacifica]